MTLSFAVRLETWDGAEICTLVHLKPRVRPQAKTCCYAYKVFLIHWFSSVIWQPCDNDVKWQGCRVSRTHSYCLVSCYHEFYRWLWIRSRPHTSVSVRVEKSNWQETVVSGTRSTLIHFVFLKIPASSFVRLNVRKMIRRRDAACIENTRAFSLRITDQKLLFIIRKLMLRTRLWRSKQDWVDFSSVRCL